MLNPYEYPEILFIQQGQKIYSLLCHSQKNEITNTKRRKE
jgi:hypothetical protein